MANLTQAKGVRLAPRLDARQIIVWVILGLLAIIVIYPVVLLAINTFVITPAYEPARYGLDNWRLAFTDRGMLVSLWNTIAVAVVVHSLSLVLAVVFAWLIARTDLPGAKWLELFFWFAFFMPTIAMLQGWILLWDPTVGLANKALVALPFIDESPVNIFSYWGIVATHIFTHAIAIKVMLLTPAFKNLDATLEEASTITGANSVRTLVRVTVPVLTPAIVTMLVLSLIHSFRSVEIELILGMPARYFVFGSKIFNLTLGDPPSPGAATALSTVVMLFMVPLVLWHHRVTTSRRYTTITSAYKPQVMKLRGWRWPIFTFVLAFGIYLTVVPAVFLLMGTFMKLFGFFDLPSGAWTLRHWQDTISSGGLIDGLKNTFLMAAGAATISSVFFAMLAYVLVRTRLRFKGPADFMTWIPQALPGIVLTLAWFWIILRTPFLRPLYGSLWALILVSAVGGMTLSVQVLKANVLQLGADLEESSEVSGASWWRTLTRIVVPLLMPTLVVVWVLNYVFTASTAVTPALLASAGTKPLALLQLQYLMGEDRGPASVVGVVLLVSTVSVALVARMLGFRIGLSRNS